MQYLPLKKVLPDSFWFKTIVNGALLEDIKHVVMGPNNGYVEILEGGDGGDGPKIKFVIGEAISIIGVMMARSVSLKTSKID